ncbi:hypothetical protein KIN20_012522 [Parelaphostrongylus tenuis]|uniref:Uncharacterized protein n=1 Tax=Parelaphostrongylus tenuis TaxID=148309 RepID=A0AAD5MX04_PARTN|nr:hypothetical protein KIN20_012522 [Parelaphostrongylus tenuis]
MAQRRHSSARVRLGKKRHQFVLPQRSRVAMLRTLPSLMMLCEASQSNRSNTGRVEYPKIDASYKDRHRIDTMMTDVNEYEENNENNVKLGNGSNPLARYFMIELVHEIP